MSSAPASVQAVMAILLGTGWLSPEEDYTHGPDGANPFQPALSNHEVRPVAEQIVAALSTPNGTSDE